MPESTPPRLARWLARRVLDARARDLVEGDLEELFAARVRATGRLRAALRYTIDVLSLIPNRRPARARRARGNEIRRAERITEELMSWIQDVRHAARTLATAPGFSAIVIVTLGLAIGANSAIFSVVDGVLLKPLPYREASQLMLLREARPGVMEQGEEPVASQSLFLAWRESGRAFEELAMYSGQQATLSGIAEPARLRGAAVSPALFPLLGVEAAVGRTFSPDEETPGRDGVIVLGESVWRRYFGGDPTLVGRDIRLDDSTRTVIGIMPPGFRFPDAETEYWVPAPNSFTVTANEDGAVTGLRTEVRRSAQGGQGGAEAPAPRMTSRIEYWGRVVGRLAAGVTPEMAADEGTRLLRSLRAGDALAREAQEQGSEPAVAVLSMQEQLVGPVRRPLLLLMGAVGFVLLIACANVANLVLARAVGRHKETAVRAALGAGWWRIGRLLVVESLLLSAVGAAAGLGLAAAGLRALASLAPDFIPRLQDVAIDARVLAFTLGISALTALLFSLAPLRSAARLDLTRALKDEHGGAGGGLSRTIARQLLVIAETAASVVLLVGAGLLVSSFLRLTSVDHGYAPDDLLEVQLQLPAASYPDAPAHLTAYDALVRRLETLPAIRHATVTNMPPSSPANIRMAMRVDDTEPASPDERPTPVGVRLVENNYFQTIGARLVAGRFFDREDRPENHPVMVLSESAAAALFGADRDPVGERMNFMGSGVEVVGIAADVRTAGVDPTPQPDVFLPLRQGPPAMVPMLFRVAHVLLRTDGAALAAVPTVRTLLGQEVQGAVLLSASTVSDRLADAVAEPRFYASLVGAFATLALVLAAVGIYGLLAYAVQQGMRETAIRRALGAPSESILRGVLGRGLGLAAGGLVLGVGTAMALSRVLESMLYEIRPTEPLTLLAVAGLFLAVAMLAIAVPARRAVRVDPMDVLRHEA